MSGSRDAKAEAPGGAGSFVSGGREAGRIRSGGHRPHTPVTFKTLVAQNRYSKSLCDYCIKARWKCDSEGPSEWFKGGSLQFLVMQC